MNLSQKKSSNTNVLDVIKERGALLIYTLSEEDDHRVFIKEKFNEYIYFEMHSVIHVVNTFYKKMNSVLLKDKYLLYVYVQYEELSNMNIINNKFTINFHGKDYMPSLSDITVEEFNEMNEILNLDTEYGEKRKETKEVAEKKDINKDISTKSVQSAPKGAIKGNDDIASKVSKGLGFMNTPKATNMVIIVSQVFKLMSKLKELMK